VINLSFGKSVTDPTARLLTFLNHEYEIYDKVDVKTDDTIELLDILVANCINARIDIAEKIRSIYNGRKAVETALTAIPADADLLADNFDWEAVENVINAFCSIKGAMESVTTKILHKKRPNLIPIMDTVLGKHYHINFGQTVFPKYQKGKTSGKVVVAYMQQMQEEMRNCEKELDLLYEAAAQNNTTISRLRIFEILLWTEVEGGGWYRDTKS
jgi:hypothetical protein